MIENYKKYPTQKGNKIIFQVFIKKTGNIRVDTDRKY